MVSCLLATQILFFPTEDDMAYYSHIILSAPPDSPNDHPCNKLQPITVPLSILPSQPQPHPQTQPKPQPNITPLSPTTICSKTHCMPRPRKSGPGHQPPGCSSQLSDAISHMRPLSDAISPSARCNLNHSPIRNLTKHSRDASPPVYLVHSKKWPLARAFMLADGGLPALVSLFTAENLYLRSQVSLAFLEAAQFDCVFCLTSARGESRACAQAWLHCKRN